MALTTDERIALAAQAADLAAAVLTFQLMILDPTSAPIRDAGELRAIQLELEALQASFVADVQS